MKQYRIIFFITIFSLALYFGIKNKGHNKILAEVNNMTIQEEEIDQNPLSIEYMRKQTYRGSNFVIEQTLGDGFNYKKYLVSYLSDSLKIYALMTIPKGIKPDTGWPVIVINHDYVNPRLYKTFDQNNLVTEAFSRNRYIVLKPDYRGHGKSEGLPGFPEFTPYYTIDLLNAISSLKKFEEVDPSRIGVWGQGMGGIVTMKALLASNDIKAASMWAGVLGDQEGLSEYHKKRTIPKYTSLPFSGESKNPNYVVQPADQSKVDIYNYLSDINIPIQLLHSTSDAEVPYEFSQKLYDRLIDLHKNVALISYDNDDHNLTKNSKIALRKTIDFFDKYLK